MASKDGGDVTERKDATTRTDTPNMDSIFKDLLSILYNIVLFSSCC
jgi:hypothetical protein